jgi:serine phosphatase RsbU (regulator of sigma subunit)
MSPILPYVQPGAEAGRKPVRRVGLEPTRRSSACSATLPLAEVCADGTEVELLSCGHPAPLLLGPARPWFIGPQEGSLPLGLGQLADVPRMPVTIAFEPGDALLFYTDGASEARNKAGVFFPLVDCAAVCAAPDPATLADGLGDEVVRYVGTHPTTTWRCWWSTATVPCLTKKIITVMARSRAW